MDGSQFIIVINRLTRKFRLGVLNEPPCAEPHAGWCGGWRLDTSDYPIRHIYPKPNDVNAIRPPSFKITNLIPTVSFSPYVQTL